MKLRLGLAMLVVTFAASVAVASPAFAANSHWTKHQAAKRYLHDVRPSNKELDRWDRLAKHTLRLNALRKEAARVAESETVFVQRLIRGKWSPRVDRPMKKLETRVLDEVRHWQDIATAPTIKKLQHAVLHLPRGSKAANRVRHVLGLPTVS
jgi:hypothetical protein